MFTVKLLGSQFKLKAANMALGTERLQLIPASQRTSIHPSARKSCPVFLWGSDTSRTLITWQTSWIDPLGLLSSLNLFILISRRLY